MWRFIPRHPLPLLLALFAAACGQPPVGTETDTAEVAPAAVDAPRITVSSADETPEPLAWIPPVVEITEGEEADALALARQSLEEHHLYEGADAAIPLYLALRGHLEYRQAGDDGLLRSVRLLLAEGQQALAVAQGDVMALQQVQWNAAVLRALAQVLEALGDEAVLVQGHLFLQSVDRLTTVWNLNTEAERELRAGHLGEDGGGALARFRAANELMPENERSQSGLAAVETALILRAEASARNDDFATAGEWLLHAGMVREEQSAVRLAEAQIEHLRSTRISRLRAQAVAGLGAYGGILKAQAILQQISTMTGPDDLVMADLRARIETASRYGPFGPGQRLMDPLHDGGHGPQMAVIPYGRFQMGAVDTDHEANANEGPAHEVQFERGFAISVNEITVAEFGRFVRASGYQTRSIRRGFSMAYDERSGNFVRRSGVDWESDYVGNPAESGLPVLHVSAVDAAAYAAWLSAQTGALYRLPSEAEFEYVLRAGSSMRYPWAEQTPPPGAGNLTGSEDQSPGGRTWANAFQGYGDGYWGPAPVGQFAGNAFGVHDLAGNVSEWVADCWHSSYLRAPSDGSAWVNPGCRDQVIRGGSWASSPAQTRASWRAPASVDTTNARIGFRVVRVL